jgi:DNA-binding NtrC family response regulator
MMRGDAVGRAREQDHDDPILVVDDDPVACRLLVDLLEEGGHRVEWTTDALRAIDRVREMRYALVVSDMWMPQMPGTALAGRIAMVRPDVPVLIVSGFPDAGMHREAQARGIDVLAKPVRMETLLAAVRSILVARERVE